MPNINPNSNVEHACFLSVHHHRHPRPTLKRNDERGRKRRRNRRKRRRRRRPRKRRRKLQKKTRNGTKMIPAADKSTTHWKCWRKGSPTRRIVAAERHLPERGTVQTEGLLIKNAVVIACQGIGRTPGMITRPILFLIESSEWRWFSNFSFVERKYPGYKIICVILFHASKSWCHKLYGKRQSHVAAGGCH